MQGLLGIQPDMTTLGKYLGGGASFGAFGGKREIMERFDPGRSESFSHAGTFNNNVLSMAAGVAGLTEVLTPEKITRTNALGERLRERLNEAAVARRVAFQATRVGSLIGLHFSSRRIRGGADVDARGAVARVAQVNVEALFHLEMLNHGFHFGRRGFIALSLPTTEADCNVFVAAVGEFLAAYRPLLETALSETGSTLLPDRREVER